jgi:anti-sigma B factor antagonist
MIDAPNYGFVADVSQAGDDLSVVRLAGELDLAGAPELSRALASIPATASTRVVVDLTKLAFMDSTGLRALIVAAKALAATGGTLTLAGPRPAVQRLFELVRLSEVIPIESSLDAALGKSALGDLSAA